MIRVVAAIIEENIPDPSEYLRADERGGRRGRLLICQRARGDAFAGKWEFPGGKMRVGETPRAALGRELREELGIEARIGPTIHRVRHRYSGMARDVEITFFYAEIRFGTPRKLCFERISWVRRGDLLAYDFLAADRFLVGQLSRGLW